MKLFSGMDNNQLSATIWTFALTAATLVISLILYTSMTEDLIVQELLEQGQDPLELTCLYKRSDNIAPACLLLIEQRSHK